MAGHEVGRHEVVDGEREGEQRPRQDRREDQRQRDEAEGHPRRCAQILGSLLDRAIEARQPCSHRDRHVGDAEHHVGDEEREEPLRDVGLDEEPQQGGAQYDDITLICFGRSASS